jgi:hypothetical protein
LATVSRPRRTLLRFSVRTLFVLVLLFGAGLGWLVRGARVQREAVAAIRHAGGGVAYDWSWSDGEPIAAGKPWAPAWLVDLVGVDYFGHVTFVALNAEPHDTAVVQVARLTEIQYLYLVSSLCDADLTKLKVLRKLRLLELRGTRVTDAGIKALKQALPSLEITR